MPLEFSHVIDLSHAVDAGPPVWPGDPPIEFESVAEIAAGGFHLRRFSMGEHAGTHANAPAGFHKGGVGIDAYPASAWVAPAAVIDFRGRPADAVFTPADLADWEGRHGCVASGSVVLLNTGRSMLWHDRSAYLGLDEGGSPHWPGFGSDTVEFLLEQRGIAGVGSDAAGVDAGTDSAFAINRRVLERPRIVLENLCHLDRLPATHATLVIGVIKLHGGTGSPASVLALV